MAYVTIEELRAAIPDEHRDAAAADEGAEAAEVLADVCASASLEVDGLIAGAVSVPAASPTATMRQAALWLAVDLLMVRRQVKAKRVHEIADGWRAHLRRIGEGKIPLSAPGPQAAGAVIAEPSLTAGGGLLL